MTEILADLSFSPVLGPEQLRNYGFAILAIAGADGELEKSERETLLRIGRDRALSPRIVEEWRKVDWQQSDLRSMLTALGTVLDPPMARLFLYDAIRVSRADGHFAIQERKAIEDAAEGLNVPMYVVHALLRLVETEDALLGMRRSLLLGT